MGTYRFDMAAADLPGLEFVDAEVKSAIDSQERRSESLDTKAGLCLGFAGLLAGLLLRVGAAASVSAYVALGVDFTVATLSLLAYQVRNNPVVHPRNLRGYIETDERVARVAVLRARLSLYDEATREARRKANLVNAALAGLLLAVMVTAVAAAQSLGGLHGSP